MAAASRANYQANGVNARDEMGSGDERGDGIAGTPDTGTNCSGEHD